MKKHIPVLILRFLRAFIAAFTGTLILVFHPTETLLSWQSFHDLLSASVPSALVAGIAAGLQVVDKAIRMKYCPDGTF